MDRVLHKILITLVVLAVAIPANADEFRVMWYNDNYPPLTFSHNDRKVGIIDDLLTAVCGLTGDTFRYVEAPFPRAMMMFEADEIDIEPSVNPAWRPDSKNSVYTIPYRRTIDTLLFADEDAYVAVKAPQDLVGKRIGVIRGYSYPGYDALFAEGALQKIESRNEEKLLEMLHLGRVDVVIIHKSYAQYKMKINKEYSGFTFGAPIYEFDIMMRFTLGNQDAVSRFNGALEQLKCCGEMERIFDKYR